MYSTSQHKNCKTCTECAAVLAVAVDKQKESAWFEEVLRHLLLDCRACNPFGQPLNSHRDPGRGGASSRPLGVPPVVEVQGFLQSDLMKTIKNHFYGHSSHSSHAQEPAPTTGTSAESFPTPPPRSTEEGHAERRKIRDLEEQLAAANAEAAAKKKGPVNIFKSGTVLRFLYDCMRALALKYDHRLFARAEEEAKVELECAVRLGAPATEVAAARRKHRKSKVASATALHAFLARQRMGQKKQGMSGERVSDKKKQSKEEVGPGKPRAMGGKGERREPSMVIEVGDFKSLAKLSKNRKCKPLEVFKTHEDAVGTMADVLLMRASGMNQRVDVAKEAAEKARGKNRGKVRREKREYLERFHEENRGEGSEDGSDDEDQPGDGSDGGATDTYRHLVNIGLLRSYWFVTQSDPIEVGKRNANLGGQIAHKLSEIYNNTLLNVATTHQLELTKAVPLFLESFWRHLAIRTGAAASRSSPSKSTTIFHAMVAESVAADDFDDRQMKMAFLNESVVFWACVSVAGCTDENAEVYRRLSATRPSPGVEATGVYAERFGFSFVPGPPPQVRTLEKFVDPRDFYDEVGGPTGAEDSDGYFVPFGGSSHRIDDMFEVLQTRHAEQGTFRDFGFDAVENVAANVLPVRTRPVTSYPTSRAAEPKLLLEEEYLDLLRPGENPEHDTQAKRGLEVKRRLQKSATVMHLVGAGADTRGRPVYFTTFTASNLAWRVRSNLAAQLVHGYAVPSLLSRAECKSWLAQYKGCAYFMPSVYTPSVVMRQLCERLFWRAVNVEVLDNEGNLVSKGRGLFQRRLAGPEMPLHPAWWRSHKYDVALTQAYSDFRAALVKEPAVPVQCIWHQCEPSDEVPRRGSVPPDPCGHFCSDEADLYSHSCSDRRGRGGDLFQLTREIGDTFEAANHELDAPIYLDRAVSMEPAPLFPKGPVDWGFFGDEVLKRKAVGADREGHRKRRKMRGRAEATSTQSSSSSSSSSWSATDVLSNLSGDLDEGG
jgi:hypothetical protein